jgi:hypothetical protein
MSNIVRLTRLGSVLLIFAFIGSLSTLRAQYRNDGCVVVTSKKDPAGGGGETFFFKNGCPQLVVIKEFVQRADGKWTGGQDCRAHDQWVQAYVNPTGSGRYIAWAQVVKSCSEEFSLKWPPDPK